MHYLRDAVIPFRGGQQLAAGLRHAELIPLEGRYHLPDAADLDRIVEATVAFISGIGAPS